MLMNSGEYLRTIEQVKQEIRTAQYRAAVQVNCELLRLYHSIGSVINAHKVWGSKFVENLAADIKLSFPEMKGYSVRNLKYMAKFAARFSTDEIVQAPLAQITWYHHIALMDKVKEPAAHIWYAEQAAKKRLVAQCSGASDREWIISAAGTCRKGIQFRAAPAVFAE